MIDPAMMDPVAFQQPLPDHATLAEAFVASQGWGAARRVLVSGDWSGRCYIRLIDDVFDPPAQIIFMDWPCTRQEFNQFIAVRDILDNLGLSVPGIMARDLDHGFMLIEDLGDDQFGRLIDNNSCLTPVLYEAANQVAMQVYRRFRPIMARGLLHYNAAMLTDQACLFASHYLPVCGLPDMAGDFGRILGNILSLALQDVPTTLILRDFTPDNLMLLAGHADQPDAAHCGLLDFQDAGLGPAGYDLVSFLEDARRDTPAIDVLALRRAYQSLLPDWSDEAFDGLYAVLAAQRLIRIIGVIGRQVRDKGNHRNVGLLPRLWRRLDGHLTHEDLQPLASWLDQNVPYDQRYLGGVS